ncbi:MAG: proteinase inhibitor I4 serpin [Anaerolineales bacterium]|nr:proteinase inhibitor I4 serpin [Anaerolineales bacterium]
MSLFRRRSEATSPRVSQAQNDLGLRLLGRLARDRAEENICLSPSGLCLSLAAAYLAASGRTQQELGRALGLSAPAQPGVDEVLREWRGTLLEQADNSSTVLASSVWLPPGSNLVAEYADRLRRSLGAEASVLLEDEASAVAQVNDWAGRMTRGRIGRVLSYIDPTARMLLLTVVDLHAKWQVAFDLQATRETPFHLAPGRLISHPLMMRSAEFPHFRTGEVEGIALPYSGGRRRLIVLLPSGDGALVEVLEGLNAATWRGLVGRLHKEPGTIALPRFVLQETTDLVDPLADLGLTRMFDPDLADFQNLGSSQGALAVGHLSQVVQLEVDEQGTEASAVTVMVQVVAWPPPRWQPFEMRVDRPFVFAIEDEPSGTLLFLGAVRDPRPPDRRTPAGSGTFEVPPGTPPEITRLAL